MEIADWKIDLMREKLFLRHCASIEYVEDEVILEKFAALYPEEYNEMVND